MKTGPAVSALALSLLAAAAFAYVMPASSILRRLVDGREDLHLSALQVSGTVSFTDEGAREAGAALNLPGDREIQGDLTFSLKLPGRCRAEVTVPEGSSSATVMAFGKKRVEGKEIASLGAAVAEVCPSLALRSTSEGEAREALERHLRSLGIDIRRTSLARFEGQIAYVIGDPPKGAPQFWIYKDSLLPARVLYADAQGTKWDVRFRDFGSPVAENWFPRIVEVAKNGELVLRFTALSADAHAKLADSLF
ncbi:MAG: hypothetical protein IRZ16_11505 [Myxococcaceae bacterium]|nr:hypothetical protein [Myxococcaceae bacterium]